MKKYLMTLAAVALVSSAFISCANEDGIEYNPANKKINEYNAAFIARYGEPGANVDWGFGQTRGITRTIQPSFNFPGDADPSKFLDDVPAGIGLLTPGIGRANHYIDETYEGELNVWGMGTEAGGWQDKSGGILYVKGNCDFSNRNFYFGGNSELYLVKGATLTLGESTGSKNLQAGTMIYIAEGAKLIADGELVLNNGLHIYNHGTIEANKLHANSNSVLYNKGTVTVDTRISVENTESVIVNDGEITAADLNTAGSGKFENNNKVTISGTTFVNSNNNTWVNNGQYYTGNFIYFAASDEVINNCKLIVEDNFLISLADNPGDGNFKMDAGSSVVTKNFYGGGNWAGKAYNTDINAQGGPFYIYMGAGSVFKVTETAIMNASKPNYGIYGPQSGDYAVFQAKNIVMGKENQGFEVTYGGNLAVVAESHFAQGNDGQANHPFIDFKDNAVIYAPGFTEGLPAINIAETECNPGFQGGGGKVYVDRVICEDLGDADDSDFNDVAFDIRYADGGAYFRVVSVGGIYPLKVDGHEVHQMFGATPKADGTYEILGEVESEEFFVDGAECPADIQVEVTYIDRSGTATAAPASTFYLKAEQGKVPQKICVPSTFKLCKERQPIGEKYPLFPQYVQGIIGNGEWY